MKKDIIIHRSQMKAKGVTALNQQDDVTVPFAMSPPALLAKNANVKAAVAKTELLGLYTQKIWVPNKEDVPEVLKKDAPSLAIIQNPNHNDLVKNSTSMTVIPDPLANNITNATDSFLQIKKDNDTEDLNITKEANSNSSPIK
jgi:hypothetical protein